LGGTVVLDFPTPLVKLVASCPGVALVVPRGRSLPPFDVYATLLSIPGLLRTTLETIPAEVPYLKADPQRVLYWGQELANVPGFRVGISWQGSKQYRGDRVRSFRLKRFAALAGADSVRLISLQKPWPASNCRKRRRPVGRFSIMAAAPGPALRMRPP